MSLIGFDEKGEYLPLDEFTSTVKASLRFQLEQYLSHLRGNLCIFLKSSLIISNNNKSKTYSKFEKIRGSSVKLVI